MLYFERECVAALSFTTSARVTAREQTFLSAVFSIGATLDYGYPSIPVPCVVVRRSSIYEIRCKQFTQLACTGNGGESSHKLSLLIQRIFNANIRPTTLDDYLIGPCVVQDRLGGAHYDDFQRFHFDCRLCVYTRARACGSNTTLCNSPSRLRN